MKIYRISLDPDLYASLAYMAAKDRISPKAWMEERIQDAWSHREEMASNPTIQMDDEPKRDIPQKRKRLADNPGALKQIKTLWQSTPRPSFAKIAAEVGYPKATVAENVKRMRAKGDLPE